MPNPKDVYDNPEQYWNFITSTSDDDFEGQCFDRKEAGQVGVNGLVSSSQLNGVREQITESISAFANSNVHGGLVVVGVSKTGVVKGISHLSEEQRNSLTDFNRWLRNHAVIARTVECQNNAGAPDKILLIYVPPTEKGICETLEDHPKAWLRNETRNTLMSEDQREQIKREKRIVDFERAPCCPFHIDDVDRDVLQEFRKVYLSNAAYHQSDEQLLFNAGAIIRDGSGFTFTNAGFLFFAANPQRLLPWAYIRLMRFETKNTSMLARGLPTFERSFDGAIPQQIRKIRSFFRESGFFKVYQKRNPEGGFIDDPEFPVIAVDEAIVNAVAHRDYGIQLPIECCHYKDAFRVENPGRILQRDQSLPSEFSLDTIVLDSMPRNSKLIEWLKIMRDEQGSAFVKALSEGTKQMRDQMAAAGLPPPYYEVSPNRTVVTLFNNSEEREAILKAASVAQTSTEFANLFPLRFITENDQETEYGVVQNRHKNFMVFLRDALSAKGWYIDVFQYSRIIAHRRGVSIKLPSAVESLLQFFPAYEMQLRQYWRKYYLCIDYTLEVKNVQAVNRLLHLLEPDELRGKIAIARVKGWQRGRIVKVDAERTLIHFFDLEEETSVPNDKVIPDLPVGLLKEILKRAGVKFDISQEIKRHSLALEPGAARIRTEKTIATAQELTESVFPLTMGELRAILLPNPVPLFHHSEATALQVYSLPEPAVEFNHHGESPNIREGITSFGAFQDDRRTIELIPICIPGLRNDMAALIERLKAGKYRYKGSERTFSTKLTYNSIVTVPSPENVLEECRRLIGEHPEWIGNPDLNRLFLVHTPEENYARDDEKSPYYQVKRFLFEQGIPCQMVDTPILHNPDWKDLNLALNIIAKCGVTPWVLRGKIPDADFFIGLSFTQSRIRGANRLVGYATVFNEFGRWEFYSGNTEVFSYEERTKYFASLTKQTLSRLTLSEHPSIYFHYSARFSREDREAILDAARSVHPGGTYSFVSINSHHNVRLYDNRGETDGSLSRGSYVVTSPHQILLSTTGYNPFRKLLGTPKPLELTLWTYKPDGPSGEEIDLKSLAVQILSLTKLNWASTESISGEPITTKYAGDIAYLTDAFLRQAGVFRLHPVLERTPWFI